VKQKDLVNKDEEILLSKRFQYPRKPIGKLNSLQLRIKELFERDLDTGELIFNFVPCYCGKDNSSVLATTDRYGFWVRTVICHNCGLIRTNPQLTHESSQKFYEKYYRSLYTGSKIPDSEFFDNQIRSGEKKFFFITQHTNLKSGNVFEVGTGAGGILIPFKNAGFDVYGVDYDLEYLQMGKDADLTLLQGGVEELSNLDVKADIIILSHVLEHVSDLDRMLRLLKECLNPEGMIYIEVPGIYSIPKNYPDFIRYLQNAHLYYFTLSSLTQIVSKNGFELVYGNEYIRAIFKQSETKVHTGYNEESAKKIISLLQQLDSRKIRTIARFRRLSYRFIVRSLEVLRLKGIIRRIFQKKS
jgi:2-polyprenyl-3-methyl-5-hydroxy-6-metoxy-1,4-benzoquinol methylase